MTIPLGVLAIGSILAGMIWYSSFFDEKFDRFFGMTTTEVHASEDGHATTEGDSHAATETDDGHGEETGDADATGHGDAHAAATYVPGQGGIYIGDTNHVMHDAHAVPKWVKTSPFVAMLLGFCLSWLFYIHNPELPKRLARTHWGIYNFLLNKWYFDELYNVIFIRPAMWLGRFFWKKGDGGTIDGFLNGLAMGIIPFFTRQIGRAQSGFLYHYAFAMFIGLGLIIVWFVVKGA